MARRICEAAKISTRANPKRIGRHEADALYQAIQKTKIRAPATDCIAPIGEELILKGLHQVVPGEFYGAATRPPAVYRGNPFLIEVGLAYGGASADAEGHARGAGRAAGGERRPHAAAVPDHDASTASAPTRPTRFWPRRKWARGNRPAKLKKADIAQLHEAMQNVNLSEGQSMNVLRYANRVPLQFQAGGLRDHADRDGNELAGLRPEPVARLAAQRAGHRHGPHGQRVGAVHQRIERGDRLLSRDQKELRLGLQAVGRKLAMYLSRRKRVRQEGERREIFLRYLGEVATAVCVDQGLRRSVQGKNCTADCWTSRNARRPKPTRSSTIAAKKVEAAGEDFGENVLIVEFRGA